MLDNISVPRFDEGRGTTPEEDGMTDWVHEKARELAEYLQDADDYQQVVRIIEDALRQVESDEREACAKIADNLGRLMHSPQPASPHDIAVAIRARGAPRLPGM